MAFRIFKQLIWAFHEVERKGSLHDQAIRCIFCVSLSAVERSTQKDAAAILNAKPKQLMTTLARCLNDYK